MASEDKQFISFQGAVQVLLTLLGFIVVGMGGLAITTYSDLEGRVRANEKAIYTLQDTAAQQTKDITSTQIAMTELQTQMSLLQRQVDTDQMALHSLGDSVQRAENPTKLWDRRKR